ncbi:hypothetical protein ACFL0Q_04835, partial [Thermodesulfobacteriota bacterium]
TVTVKTRGFLPRPVAGFGYAKKRTPTPNRTERVPSGDRFAHFEGCLHRGTSAKRLSEEVEKNLIE